MNQDRWRASGLLGILAAAAIVIAITNTFGVTDPQRWLGLSGAAFGIVGMGMLLWVQMDRAEAPRTQTGLPAPPDLTLMAYGFGFGAAATALIAAGLGQPGAGYVVLGAAMAWVLIWLPVGTRTVVVECHVVIDRDPAAVFAYVSDKCNLVHWFPNYLFVEMLTPGPIGPGTRFRCQVQVGGRTIDGVEEIVSFQPPVLFTSRAVEVNPNIDLMRFDAIGGQTQVTHRYQGLIPYPSALAGRATGRSKTRAAILAVDTPAFARLKQVLEHEPAAV